MRARCALLAMQALPPAEQSPDRRLGRLILWPALALGLAARLYLAVTDDGLYWPDELYQSFEPAHRLVFGYGLVAWEFIEGARNWALPGLVALLLKGCALLGLDAPSQYVTVVKAAFALCGAATALGAFRLARSSAATPAFAAAGAAAFALAAPAIYFAPRAMSETASALPVVFGLALALSPSARRLEVWGGAALLGMAVMLRLQNGIFCLGLLFILLARRDWRRLLESTAVLGIFAFLFGLLDRLTWAEAPGVRFGGWFHSAVKYLQFNLIEGRASAWGVSEWSYFFKHLFLTMPALSVLLVLLSVLALRRAPGLTLVAFAFFGLHSAVGHKEFRFIYPMLPVLCALSAVGLSALPRRLGQVALPLLLLAAGWSGLTFRSLTMGQVGQYPDRKADSAYDDFGPVNRMLLAASTRPDVCGIRIDAAHLAWTGGTTYLHHPAPLYHLGHPPIESGYFNYLVTSNPAGIAGEVVARDARVPSMVLLRLPQHGCTPNAGYPWRLP